MAYFESGVEKYITGYAVVEVSFPVGFNGVSDISCRQCGFFARSTGQCQLTKEITAYPDRYVGAKCPLELKEE